MLLKYCTQYVNPYGPCCSIRPCGVVWLCVLCRGDSSSRSSSPEKEAKIEYITSFGGEDKQKHGEHHSASSSKGGVSGSTAMRKGGAGGSSRSGGMAGGRRESRCGGEERRPSSSSRSRYSEREWRSDSRRHRCVWLVTCWVCVHLCVMHVFSSIPDLRPGRAAEDEGIHAVVPGLFPITEVDIGLGIEKSDILDPTHDPLHLVGSDGSPDPRFQLVGIEVEAEVRIVGVSCSTAGNQSLAQRVLQVHLQDQNRILSLHLLLRSGTEEAPQPHQMTNTHHLNRKVKKQHKNQLHCQLSRIKIRLVTWYGVEFIVCSTHCLLQRCF